MNAPVNTDKKAHKVTPMMAQFLGIKAEAGPDVLLFYRMGDFYELFFDDAVKAAEALDIALTKRGKHKGEDIAMCGVPVHSSEAYLQRLIKKGFRVAVCEQTESPAEAKKRGYKAVVNRAIVRVVTPGTLTEDTLLDARGRNLILALSKTLAGDYALAWADISDGLFHVCDVPADRLPSELSALSPREIVLPESLYQMAEFMERLPLAGAALTPQPSTKFDIRSGERRLKERFDVKSLDGYGDFSKAEISAAGALLDYLELTQAGKPVQLSPPQRRVASGYMAIDPATPSTLYAGVRDFDLLDPGNAQIYKSTDSGATWALSSAGISPTSDIRAIVVDADNPATVYAALAQTGASPGGVYRSDDFGVNWTSISVGLPVSSATALAIDNTGANSVIYAGTGSGVFELEQLPDLDLDGASSAEESGAPNGGDGNADGTADADQTSVASIPLPAGAQINRLSQATTTPQPYLTIAISGGSCDRIVNAQLLGAEDFPQQAAYVLPVGMLSFELPDCAMATVDLIFSGVDLATTDRYRNFGPTTPGDPATLTSYDFAGATRDGNTWSLNLVDGALGDVRPEDGTILLRGGPAEFINDLFADGFE